MPTHFITGFIVQLGLAVLAPTAVESEPLIVDVVGNGDITVMGSKRSDVRAHQGNRALEVRRSGRRIEVALAADVDEASIEIPQDAELRIRTRSGDIDIRDVEGPISAGSTAGDVVVVGKPKQLEIETVAGDVDVQQAPAGLKIRTVSGDVTAKFASGKIDIKLTSGNVAIGQAQGSEVRISTMSGDITYTGYFTGETTHELRTYQGDISVRPDRKWPVSIQMMSLSGNTMSHVEGEAKTQGEVQIGSGGPKLQVQTMSGNIHIR